MAWIGCRRLLLREPERQATELPVVRHACTLAQKLFQLFVSCVAFCTLVLGLWFRKRSLVLGGQKLSKDGGTPLDHLQLAAAATLTAEAFQGRIYKAIVQMTINATPCWLFERNYWLRLDSQSGYCVFEGEDLVMFYMLEKPDLPRLSLWDMICAGLPAGYVLHGPGAMRRLLETKAWFEMKEREVLGDRAGTVARLERVTVTPGRQGQGVGSAALRSALREADLRGLAVVLGTQEMERALLSPWLRGHLDDECPLGGGTKLMMLRAHT